MTLADHTTTSGRRVAIIGGGASGAITLDSLIQESSFEKITLFERRERPGGVWIVDEDPAELDVKPGAGHNDLDPAVEAPSLDRGPVLKKRPVQQRFHETASYKGLRTNIPEQLMTFSDDKQWREEKGERVDGAYVHGVAIQRYIERYINRHNDHVVYRTTVERVDKDYAREGAPFVLTLRTETNLKDEVGDPLDEWWEEVFDSVIVCTGHYHVPYIPDVPGLSEVYERFPGLVKHSKGFRSGEQLRDKEVIVIGTRSSGADIVELGSKTAKKIYHSQRGQKLMRKTHSDNVELKTLITSYEIVDNEVYVHFKNGSVVKNPDLIYYATGFRYSYPFLTDTYGAHLSTGTVVPDLYLHTFFSKDPQLSFVGVPCDAISFRAFEYQAILVSRFLAGKVDLPSLQEQVNWCVKRFREKGDTRSFHTIDWEHKFEYLEYLVQIGGGHKSIGKGRDFPEFSKEDQALHHTLAERLKAFYSIDESEISGVSSININN